MQPRAGHPAAEGGQLQAAVAYFASLAVPSKVLDDFAERMSSPRGPQVVLVNSGELEPSRLAAKTAALEGVLHMAPAEVRA